jgi:hypothetical protein
MADILFSQVNGLFALGAMRRRFEMQDNRVPLSAFDGKNRAGKTAGGQKELMGVCDTDQAVMVAGLRSCNFWDFGRFLTFSSLSEIIYCNNLMILSFWILIAAPTLNLFLAFSHTKPFL